MQGLQGVSYEDDTKGGAKASAASQGGKNHEGTKPWHQTKVQMVASFVATIALFAVFTVLSPALIIKFKLCRCCSIWQPYPSTIVPRCLGDSFRVLL